ncbi:MAG: type II toxin-antitoxin system Y4mF family antitoxin [Myxococcales bacterium]|nr:type II toxin-antitoxin system Y4mF family antitoxin [Myxococcales bacterium]
MATPNTDTPTGRLAAALRARRRELGLTQKQLGDLAGCGVAFLYELEAGKPTVRLDKLLDVLAVLGLELRLDEGHSGLAVAAQLQPPADGDKSQ